jgi:hypothetical protein
MTRAPWNEHERWETWTDGTKTFARVTGRTPAPTELKRDPRWWLRNDFEQQVTDADAQWYHPEWPEWRRKLYWDYFRNPLQNYRAFVIGVMDKNYTVEVLEGVQDPFVVQRDDVGQEGYQKCRLYDFEDGTADKYFTSYCSAKMVYYYGWQPSGFAGVKFVWR